MPREILACSYQNNLVSENALVVAIILKRIKQRIYIYIYKQYLTKIEGLNLLIFELFSINS